MEKETSKRFATYAPVAYKTFAGALNAFFENELPTLGGNRVRMTVVNAINAMVARFFPDVSFANLFSTNCYFSDFSV